MSGCTMQVSKCRTRLYLAKWVSVTGHWLTLLTYSTPKMAYAISKYFLVCSKPVSTIKILGLDLSIILVSDPVFHT